MTDQFLVGVRLGIIGVVAALVLWHFFLPIQRFKEGELTAFFLAIFTFCCTVLLLFGELFGVEPGPWLFGYAFLMMLGDAVKLMFLYHRPDFRVVWFNHTALYIMTFIELAAHITLWILQVVVWMTTYVDVGQ